MTNNRATIDNFISLFTKERGLSIKNIKTRSLAGDGSKRHFQRIILPDPNPSFILMENFPDNAYLKRENSAYLMIGKHLFKKGLPVPKIYRFDLHNGLFILEDMGDKNLQSVSTRNKKRLFFYEQVVDILFRFQIEGAGGFDTSWCCQTEKYDGFVMRRYESDYFRDSFLSKYHGIKNDLSKLDDPFNHLALMASKPDNIFFLHRDFQSRNIMIGKDKLGILDWQGARLGPLAYDASSLIIDPYVDLSIDERNHILQQYISLVGKYHPAWVEPFKKYYPYLAVQRNLQIIGAFSFLSRVKGKKYFEAYIPAAINSLNRILDELNDSRLSLLTDFIHSIVLDYNN